MFFVFLLFPLITFRLSSIFFSFSIVLLVLFFLNCQLGDISFPREPRLCRYLSYVSVCCLQRRFSFRLLRVFHSFFFWDSIWCEKYDRLFFLLFHCLVLQCRWFLRARPADKTRIRLARIWEPPTFNLWFSVLSHFSKASAARLACQRSQWMLIMSKRPLLIVRLLLPGNNKNGRGDRKKKKMAKTCNWGFQRGPFGFAASPSRRQRVV